MMEAFLWTPETGMVGLGDLPGNDFFSKGHGINDLDQVVGMSVSDSGQEAFLWDPSDGMLGLGFLPGGGVSVANDINNATQVVGSGCSAERLEAFIWDRVNGMRGLGSMPGGHYAVTAYAINELGQAVGRASNDEAFLWDPVDGLTTLGVLPGVLPVAYGWGVNDLEQVVGWNLDLYTAAQDAFIWDREHGMRNLEDLLAAATPSDSALLRWASGINNAGQIVAQTKTAGLGVLLTPFVLGDLNCDELVDETDIPALLLLLVDPDQYAQSYPDCPGEWAGDVNQDAVLDSADLYTLRDFLGSAPSVQPSDHLPPDHTSPAP
jgi:probable HAF family extracellular repeat protein